MNNAQRQEIMRRQAEGMRAISNEEMEKLQAEAAEGMHQRGPLTNGEQEAMCNFWGGTADEQNNFIPSPLKTTLFKRFISWVRAYRKQSAAR
jgi:hypothetical protein